jgi:hypothetical protein
MIDNVTKPSFIEIIPHLKRDLGQAIKDSGISKDQIADRIDEILEVKNRSRELLVSRINSCTKHEKNRLITLELLPIFCFVTKSLEPIRALIEPLDAKIIFGRQMNLLELGEALLMERQADKKERLALMRMGVNEEKISEVHVTF